MKISDVKVYEIPYKSKMVRDGEFHSHPGKEHDSKENMLKIETDEGVYGIYFGPLVKSVVLSGCKDILIGEDPLYREKINKRLTQYQRLQTELNDRTLSAIDCALWDLAGRYFNVPVYKLLGAYRDTVPAYASIMVGDNIKGGLDTPGAYADFALKLVDEGYKAIKIHTWMPPIIPRPSVELDLECCRKVRKAVGDDIALMLDPYHFYSREEAVKLAKGLEELNFLWLEEPMDEHSMSSYEYLTSRTELNICGPETVEGKELTRATWVEHKASTIGRAGCLITGGITGTIRCMNMYRSHGISCELHGNHIGNLHVLGSVSMDGKYFERGLLHPMLNYEEPKPWLNSIYDKMDENGNVKIPADPGLGYDINWDYINYSINK